MADRHKNEIGIKSWFVVRPLGYCCTDTHSTTIAMSVKALVTMVGNRG